MYNKNSHEKERSYEWEKALARKSNKENLENFILDRKTKQHCVSNILNISQVKISLWRKDYDQTSLTSFGEISHVQVYRKTLITINIER